MDDVSSRMSEFLKDPKNFEKIRQLASMLGGAEEPAESPRNPPPDPPGPERQPDAPPDADVMKMMMKFAPLVSRFRREDDTTRLLRALRPFLSENRKKKLDESIRLMQLVRVMPYLKKTGLF